MKDESSPVTPVIFSYHSACLSVLLLFALISLAPSIQVTGNRQYALTLLNCQTVQNEYPKNANAGQKIVITTTVTSPCVSVDYNQVIVNILLPNSSIILSTAPAIISPAVNTVRAPPTGGSWSLIVQVLWMDYPMTGTLASYQTTITIMINGPLAISTVTSHTAYSTKFTSSRIGASSTVSSYSEVTSVKVSSSTVVSYSIQAKSITGTSVPPTTISESTFNTPSSLPSNSFFNILHYSWSYSTGGMILAVVAVVLLVGFFALKRRRR